MSFLVLVVDDDRDGREMYAEYIESVLGLRTITASDGREALAIAQKELPTVIVLDLSLPVIDGREVARRIKADPATRNTRIIALSGYGQGEEMREALAAGCDHYLRKPCLPSELVRLVTACLPR